MMLLSIAYARDCVVVCACVSACVTVYASDSGLWAVMVMVADGGSVCLRLCLTRGFPPLPLSSPPSSFSLLARRSNKLGAAGGTAVAHALQHVPQLRELSIWCALATALPARGVMACCAGVWLALCSPTSVNARAETYVCVVSRQFPCPCS